MADNFFNIDDGESTNLAEQTIRTVDKANEIFGRQLPGGALPIVLLPGRNCLKPYFTVPEGCYALVQRFGAIINNSETKSVLWPPGLHIAPPWVKVSHLITEQSFVFNTPVKECPTADNVKVTIDVSLTVRIMGTEDPQNVYRFVFDLTPRQLEYQLRDALDEAVRRLGRAVNHTEVYGLRSMETQTQVAEAAGLAAVEGEERADDYGGLVTDAMKSSLNGQFNKFGVQITDVAITNVRLPPHITKQMQEKTTYASVISEQKMKQENDMQLLAMKEEVETANQKKKEEQMEEDSVGIRLCAEKKKELDTIEATTKKMVRELKEEEKAQVRQIDTEAALEVKGLEMEKEKILKNLAAETAAQVENIRAEADKYIRTKRAEVEVVKAKARAESERLTAEAEGEAAAKLREKRSHDLALRQLRVYQGLAKNKETVISGNTGDSLLAEMLVAQRQSQILVSVNAKGGKVA